jgi:hypothetical protein
MFLPQFSLSKSLTSSDALSMMYSNSKRRIGRKNKKSLTPNPSASPPTPLQRERGVE